MVKAVNSLTGNPGPPKDEKVIAYTSIGNWKEYLSSNYLS
jgi:hypothetical protein